MLQFLEELSKEFGRYAPSLARGKCVHIGDEELTHGIVLDCSLVVVIVRDEEDRIRAYSLPTSQVRYCNCRAA